MTFNCSKCGEAHEVLTYSRIDASSNPELKERLLNGDLFLWTCPECRARNVISYSTVYTDSSEGVLVCLSRQRLSSEGSVPGFPTARQVPTVGDFIEKVKIFDAGLDDMAIEICKAVTVKELGKEVALRFLKTEGPDGEITFTYPENGQMQMLEVGFNVYQDCCAIIARNPKIGESAEGLSVVDGDWVSGFFV